MIEKIINLGLHTKKLLPKTGIFCQDNIVFINKINMKTSHQFLKALEGIQEGAFAEHPLLIRTNGDTAFMNAFTHNPPNGQDAMTLDIPDIMGQDRVQYLLERGIAAPVEAIELVIDNKQVQRDMYLEEQ